MLTNFVLEHHDSITFLSDFGTKIRINYTTIKEKRGWGIIVSEYDSDDNLIAKKIKNITIYKEEIDEIVQKFYKNSVTLMTLEYVLEDLLFDKLYKLKYDNKNIKFRGKHGFW